MYLILLSVLCEDERSALPFSSCVLTVGYFSQGKELSECHQECDYAQSISFYLLVCGFVFSDISAKADD